MPRRRGSGDRYGDQGTAKVGAWRTIGCVQEEASGSTRSIGGIVSRTPSLITLIRPASTDKRLDPVRLLSAGATVQHVR